MIYASATSLSTSLTPAERSQGWLYPEIARIRDVSVVVAMGVIRAAQEAGVARENHIKGMGVAELEKWVRGKMYEPLAETRRVEEEVRGLAEYDLPRNGMNDVNGENSFNETNGKSHL